MERIKPQLTLRTRWLLLRSRMSIPCLIASYDEKRIIPIVSAISGSVAILIISLFAALTGLPLVFPALGPTAFILFSKPFSRAAAPRNVVLGHGICLGCGYAVWQLMSVLALEPLSVQSNSLWLYGSAAATLGLCCFFLLQADCPHPPACASGLVVALGLVTQPLDILLMQLVIVALAYQAVGINRFAGLPIGLWRVYKYNAE